jgi:hypothetical protein
MLVVPEYLFSSTKFLISELQNKLGVDIIKAFECLKLWYKITGWEAKSEWLEKIIGVKPSAIG